MSGVAPVAIPYRFTNLSEVADGQKVNANNDVMVQVINELAAALNAGIGTVGNLVTRTVSDDYPVTAFDRTILVDASANDVTVTLLASNSIHAKQVSIKRRDGSDYTVKVVTSLGDALEDGDEYLLETKWAGATFQPDGVATWIIF